MFLRRVLFVSTVQTEVECYVVDKICSHDVGYVAGFLIVCLFRKSYGVPRHYMYPVTICDRVGRPYSRQNFAMEKLCA